MAIAAAPDRPGTGWHPQPAGEGEPAPRKASRQILGTAEVLTVAFAGQGIGHADFGRFLFRATVGNTLGGVVFVAFLKHGHARPEAPAP